MDGNNNQPEIFSVQPNSEKHGIFNTLKNFAAKHKILDIVTVAAVIIIVGGIFYFGTKEKGEIISRPEYVQAYTLVNDKISQSAAIIVFLPKGVDKITAQNNIKFDPQIEGKWTDGEFADRIIFQPSRKPEIGKYYSAILQTDTVNITKDFLVDEDPKIDAVFPASGSEASENSSVTVVFNRPMVPLTSLDVLYEQNVPVEITPATAGKFKWISTRNLQFIPETRLERSSSYSIRIKEGLVSMDGLPVSGQVHNFKTRPLRYVNISSGQTLYNQPMRITFNQPVDLERTKNEITLTDNKMRLQVPFIAEYGSRAVYNKDTKKNEIVTDRSIVNVYLEADRHGRSKLWNFDTGYNLQIKKAYPAEGDINLDLAKYSSIQVPAIIQSFSASSDRSRYVSPDFFDPQGKLVVKFYEDINLSGSKITAKGLKEMRYGEKCKTDEEGNVVRSGTQCEKTEDKSLIYLIFEPGVFNRSENISIEFQKAINASGLQLNIEPIVKTAITYPDIKITKTSPADGAANASLVDLIICSNTPLKQKTSENYKEAIVTNSYAVFNYWGSPYRVKKDNYYRGPCSTGEFHNQIRYGLIPQSPYILDLKLADDFGQLAEKTIGFTTAEPESFYLRFQNLQKGYNVTSPAKTRLTYVTENFDYVNLHICKTSASAMLEYLLNGINRFSSPETEKCDSVKEDTIQLPKRYWVNNYFQINIKDYFPNVVGHYILTFSHPNYKDSYDKKPLFERTYLSVTELAVGEKQVQWKETFSDYDYYYAKDPAPSLTQKAIGESDQNLYWVSKIGTLEPVKGALVTLYTQEKRGTPLSYAASYTTGGDGLARGPAVKGVIAIIVRSGGDSAIVSSRSDNLYYAANSLSAAKTYIYTDRPIYRPGDEVFIKGIYRVGYDGSYEVFKDKDAAIQVYSSGYEGNMVHEADLKINDFGTFNTSFKLTGDAPLGTYRISVLGTNSYFDVEEYVPAAFKAEIKTDKDEYISGDTLTAVFDANYYFGVPVSGGEVNYSVTAQDYYFDKYQDEYFNFGGNWYYCYDCGYGDTFLFRGKAPLDQNGHAQIQRKMDLNELFNNADKATSKIFVISAAVKDSAGRSISVEKSFIVHDGEFYVGLKTGRYFLGKNENFKVRAKTVDTQGKEVSESNLTLEINKITWRTFKRREVDGGFYYQSEEEKTLIQKFNVNTDKNGNWQKDISLAEEGEYEISLWGNDKRGNFLKTTSNIYIYGEGQVSIKPSNNYTLDLQTEKTDVNVGDKPKIIIKSPYQKAKALVTVDRGQIFDYWLIDINHNLYDIDISIKEEYIPNVFVSVLLLSPEPEIKFGQLQFNIDRSHYRLNVEVKTDKNFYLPGETVHLDIKTTNYLNQPVSAELSLAVADLSVLALKGNPKKNPLVFFYNGFPLTVMTASNIKNILYEIEIPLGTKGGGGLEAPEDLVKKKRGIFRDTAFWTANVTTGTDGKNSVSFTLPDNLTTWQIETVGVTKDTLLGADYNEFTAKKNLMLTPLKPRFVVPGDEFSIGAKIFNETGSKQKLDVSFESATLFLKDDGHKSVNIDAGETVTVYFSVVVPENYRQSSHQFILSAENDDYKDTVENSISITEDNTYETVATANYTKADIAKEYIYPPKDILADKGGLTVKTNATMAVFLTDALKYLVSYPYGCTEQIASKLSSIAIVKRGLNLKNVGDKFKLEDIKFEGQTYSIDDVLRIGLSRIYQNQDWSGGFVYYAGMQPNFYLTLSVLSSLNDLRLAGFDVSDSVIKKAADYVYKTITTDSRYYQNKNLVIISAYSLAQMGGFSAQNSSLKQKVISYVQDARFINEQISSIALSQLAIVAVKENYPADLANKVFQILENRINIDSRGAYLKTSANAALWSYYETPVKDTAYLLKALVAAKKEHPLTDKIVRWLLKSRQKDGAWGSSNNTLSVISSFTDFLEWQRETESKFKLDLKLNDAGIASFDFGPETILQTFEKIVPMSDLEAGKMNTLVFDRTNLNKLQNNFYYDIAFKYFLPVNQIPPRDEGITITREFYRLDDEKMDYPVQSAAIGDVLRGRLTITIPKVRNFLSIEDFIPAGFELVNFNLSTEDQTLNSQKNRGYRGDGGLGAFGKEGFLANIWNTVKSYLPAQILGPYHIGDIGNEYEIPYEDTVKIPSNTLRPDFKEFHDDRLFLFKENVSPGVYTYDYYIRALVPGKFHHLPAVASEMYFPENFGRTSGSYFEVIKN